MGCDCVCSVVGGGDMIVWWVGRDMIVCGGWVYDWWVGGV